MSVTKKSSRKEQYVAELTIDHSNGLVSAAEFGAIDMPAGSVLDDAYIVVDELFNPTTSAVFEFGITGSTAKFVASQNVFTGQALGGRAGVATGKGYRFTAPAAIVGKYTSGGGTATGGTIRLVVLFHYENESDFTITI